MALSTCHQLSRKIKQHAGRISRAQSLRKGVYPVGVAPDLDLIALSSTVSSKFVVYFVATCFCQNLSTDMGFYG